MSTESMFKHREININGQMQQLLWPAIDEGCLEIISLDWSEMNPIIVEHTPTRHTVVQAGGNCGLYPLLHSLQFDRVFTFEPDPVNFYCLANNCKHNRIVKFNTAVGEGPASLEMGIVEHKNVGMHKIGAGEVKVYSMSIDSLAIPDVSLLHLDVEGYELNALKGSVETINRCRPTIAVEISQDEEETKQFIESLNYKLIYSKVGNSANYIYIPKERA